MQIIGRCFVQQEVDADLLLVSGMDRWILSVYFSGMRACDVGANTWHCSCDMGAIVASFVISCWLSVNAVA